MNKKALMVALLALSLGFWVGCQKRVDRLRFGGGPTGGTFQLFAEGMAEVIEQGLPDVHIAVERSGRSLANLRAVDRGAVDVALVYAGDAYLGRKGELGREEPPIENVRALTRLYGASAQLVVLKDSPIRSPFDLKGKRVDIGNSGSGAALSAERFFRALGIWGSIIPVHVGYTMAMDDLSKGAVSAVWELVGIPSASLRDMSRQTPVRLLDLLEAARAKGLFTVYPFYAEATIPRGTYEGQGRDVRTFQDAALLVASPEVSEEWVYRALGRLFSDEGLARMRKVHPSARDLDPAKGLLGVEIPLHPAAERFWRERGVLPASE